MHRLLVQNCKEATCIYDRIQASQPERLGKGSQVLLGFYLAV